MHRRNPTGSTIMVNERDHVAERTLQEAKSRNQMESTLSKMAKHERNKSELLSNENPFVEAIKRP